MPTSDTAIARKTNRGSITPQVCPHSMDRSLLVYQLRNGGFPVASALVDANDFLALSRRGDDVWTFNVDERLITPGKFLFGGCGLAAGLVALEEASGRPTIWASAQYLSYAQLGADVNVTTKLVLAGGT